MSVAGVARLGKLATLRDLCLAGTRPIDDEVSEFDFSQLEALTQLEGLGLSDTSVTDRDLLHIRKLSQLTNLFLDRTNVTDAGLEQLKGLTHMKFLSVSNPKVTAEGEKGIRAALPNCSIGHPPQPRPKVPSAAARGRG